MRWGGTHALLWAIVVLPSLVACSEPPREPTRIVNEPPARSFECARGDAVVAAIDGASVSVVDASGSTREIDRFDLPHEPRGIAIEAAGPYIAAAAWSPSEDEGQAIAEVLVLCADGLTAFRERYTLPLVSIEGESPIRDGVDVIASPDGRFAFSFDLTHSHLGVLVSEARTATWEEPCGLWAMGERGDVLLVCDSTRDLFELQWLDPAAMTMTPIRSRRGPSCVWNDELVCLDEAGTALQIERRDGLTTWPLSSGAFDPDDPYVTDNAGEHLLVGGMFGMQPRAIVDLDARTERTFVMGAPRGMRPFRARPQLEITSDGAIATTFRNARHAQTYVSRDGVSWRAIGRPFSGTLGVDVDETGGTFVISPVDPRIVGHGRWAAARASDPEPIAPGHTLLVRGDVEVGVEISPLANVITSELSQDGARFGFVDPEDRVRFVDMETGRVVITGLVRRDPFAFTLFD